MMKILNKFSVLSVIIIASLMLVISCTDEDKDNLHGVLTKDGGFVRFTKENPPIAVGVNSISELSYSFSLSDANNNVSTYDLSMYAILSGVATDTVPVESVTSFPTTLSYDINDFTSLLGITESDITFGDQIFFTAIVTTNDGTIYTTEELNFDDLNDGDKSTYILTGGGTTGDLLTNAGYRQAFTFDFIILCPDPFTAADFAGTWQITVDDFETFVDDGVFQIIEGPGENQVTMIDPFGHPNPDTGGTYNVIIDFNPISGEVTVDKQAAWHCVNFGCGFGEGRVEGSGFVFICADLMKLQLTHTVDAGSFGTYAMDMVKL